MTTKQKRNGTRKNTRESVRKADEIKSKGRPNRALEILPKKHAQNLKMWCSFRMVKVKANRAIHCLHSGATMKPNNNYVVFVFFKNCKAHPSLKWLGRR